MVLFSTLEHFNTNLSLFVLVFVHPCVDCQKHIYEEYKTANNFAGWNLYRTYNALEWKNDIWCITIICFLIERKLAWNELNLCLVCWCLVWEIYWNRSCARYNCLLGDLDILYSVNCFLSNTWKTFILSGLL